MARRRRPGAEYDSPERGERISRGLRRHHALRRAAQRVRPSDLKALARGAPMREELRPLVAVALAEADQLVAGAGGEGASTARVLIAQDVARLGLLVRGLLLRFASAADAEAGELASKIGSLIGHRRSSLVALGLDEQRNELDLDDYLAQRSAAQRANGGEPVSEAGPAGERVPVGAGPLARAAGDSAQEETP